MPPQFFEAGQPVRHPLEVKFNAGAWDILCAIEKGFRAQVDVKGKLAEWFLYKVLEELKATGGFTPGRQRSKKSSPCSRGKKNDAPRAGASVHDPPGPRLPRR